MLLKVRMVIWQLKLFMKSSAKQAKARFLSGKLPNIHDRRINAHFRKEARESGLHCGNRISHLLSGLKRFVESQVVVAGDAARTCDISPKSEGRGADRRQGVRDLAR